MDSKAFTFEYAQPRLRYTRIDGIADAQGSDAGMVVSYSYLGAGTIVGDSFGNGMVESTTLDRFSRVGEMSYVSSAVSGNTLADYQYGYDSDGNELYMNDQTPISGGTTTANAAGFSEAMTYDGLDRLTTFKRGTVAATDDEGLGTIYTISGSPTDSESWTLDPLGNWTDYTVNGDTQTDATDGQNELTDSTLDGTDNTQSFDNAGNTTSDISGNAYTYDAWNRMVSASAYGETLSYDANGRQIGVSVTGSATVWSYYSSSGQVLETNADGNVINQNVWGIDYVNHLIERDDNSTSGNLGFTGSGLGVRIYAITDANYNVTGLVDTSGNVLQRFMYGAYGTMTVLDANYNSTSDGYNWQIGFQGGMTDPVTGLVHFDARYYNPVTGRWMEQDPAGPAGSGTNLYQAFNSNPNNLDPTGLYALNDTLQNLPSFPTQPSGPPSLVPQGVTYTPPTGTLVGTYSPPIVQADPFVYTSLLDRIGGHYQHFFGGPATTFSVGTTIHISQFFTLQNPTGLSRDTLISSSDLFTSPCQYYVVKLYQPQIQVQDTIWMFRQVITTPSELTLPPQTFGQKFQAALHNIISSYLLSGGGNNVIRGLTTSLRALIPGTGNAVFYIPSFKRVKTLAPFWIPDPSKPPFTVIEGPYPVIIA